MHDNKFITEFKNILAEKGIVLRKHSYSAIPVPSLAFQYLLAYEGFPLQILTQIVGKKSTFKSTLALEIARWHQPNGVIIYIDTEGGSNVFAAKDENIITMSVDDIDEWIQNIAELYDYFKTKNLQYPACIIIDSIAGVTTKQMACKFEEDKMVTANYPVEAKLLSTFFKLKSKILNEFPVSMIGINHLKETINPQGIQEEYSPGGKQLQYNTNLQLRTKKVQSPTLKDYGYYAEIEIRVDFNRLGPEGRTIIVPIQFIYDENNKDYQAKFDWSAATAKLLIEPKGTRDAIKLKKFYKSVYEILQIKEKSGGPKGIVYYCEELGIGPSDAVSLSEIGQIIENNKKIVDELKKIMMIREAKFISLKEKQDAE